MSKTIASITIEDPVEAHDQRAVEVTITMQNGSRRWCFFVTPDGIPNFGDYLDSDQEVRIHFGAAHMIVIKKIPKTSSGRLSPILKVLVNLSDPRSK